MRRQLRSPPAVLVALGVIVAIGIVLRLAGLGGQSFWVDEAFTAVDIHRPLGDIVPRLRAEESTPPLYFWAAWGWTHVFGDGDFALRSLSLVFGVATIPVAFALGASLAGSGAGLGAAALTAVSPYMVWYSQEARAYALFALLGLLSVLALVEVDRRDGDRAATAVWGVICALALATHYFAAVLVWPEAAWLLWRRRTRFAEIVVGALAALQLALVTIAVDQSSNSATIGEQGLARRAASIPKQYVLGQFADQLDTPVLVATAALLAAAVTLFVVVDPTARRAARPLIALVGIGVGLCGVLALVGLDRLNGRNLIQCLALALVAGGVGLVAARRALGFALLGLLLVLFASMSVAVATTPRLQRDDWKGVADELRPLPGPLDVVVIPGAWSPALQRYLDGARPLEPGNAPRSVAYVRVERPVKPLSVQLPGFSETRRVTLPSAEIVVLEPQRRRRTTAELLAQPIGGTFVGSVLTRP